MFQSPSHFSKSHKLFGLRSLLHDAQSERMKLRLDEIDAHHYSELRRLRNILIRTNLETGK